MSLADWFYILAIIYMGMGIVLLVAIVIGIFYIKKRITDMQRTVEDFPSRADFTLSMAASASDAPMFTADSAG